MMHLWRSPRQALPGIFCLGILFLMNSGIARGEVRSIQEFMTFKEKWETFVLTEYVWQLEGRYSSVNDGTLTFTNCPLPFRISSSMANNRSVTGVVEVTGKIVKEEKGLAFQVDKLVSRPRDIDRLKSMRFGIDIQKPQDWYRLADWARERGEFYNDRELTAAVVDLDRNGILSELRQLKADDEQGFAALIQKAREKQLDESLLQQLMHDQLQARFLSIRNREFSDNAYRDLQLKIQKELLQESRPLPAFPAELNARYFADPKGVYTAASSEERQILARLFLIEILTQRILHSAPADGSQGFEIADRFRVEVPERKDLAKKNEEAAVTWRMSRIKTSTRTQLDELTTRLEQYGQPELAVEAKKKWLASREAVFRQDGARGLSDLAQLWLSLLKDETKAASLFMEAWRENPQYTPAMEWLTSHGYRLVGQAWLTEAEIAAMPEDPMDKAIREGRIEIGMTAQQAQAAMEIVPTFVNRSASRKQISEWWIYQDAGVVIYLVKQTRDRAAMVVSVEKLSGQETKPVPSAE